MIVTKHAYTRMQERNIVAPTALACVAMGEKSPGRLGATRHHLMGYTAVTVPCDNGLRLVTVYNGRPHDHIGAAYEPRRRTRDPTCSVI
ncbi:DUF4258 domain-containing protein [Desulfovibrio sp. Huiquan2017]|uniref:DUF4258 domain-containing protein n=1 Tax=Desulfovibrio sp. Huiquan2017 TaxID=2816861 RepID=UPI001A914DFA